MSPDAPREASASPCAYECVFFESRDNLTIGRRCEAFAAKGCTVYATARRLEAIGDFGSGNIHKLTLDVTKEDEIKAVVATIVEAEGQIDILVNNAGIANKGTLIAVLKSC